MRISLFILLLLTCFISVSCAGQKKALDANNNFHNFYVQVNKGKNSFKTTAEEASRSSNSYKLMNLRKTLASLNAILSIEEDERVIQEEIEIIDNLLHTAQISKNIKGNKSSYKDEFKGWVSLKNNGTLNQEVPLYESYSFFYITQFLYYLKMYKWPDRAVQNKIWFDETISFIEKNIWDKWYVRSLKPKGNHYWYFLRGRTHMGAHWAGVAMYLGNLTTNQEVQRQTNELQRQYDLLLKRNLRLVNNKYVWNSTYDDVQGTYATAVKPAIIQDVSHGNHVVSYIVAAYEFGSKTWTKKDIGYLANTLKYNMYNKEHNYFKDNVDGSEDANRPGWGNFIADGWAKLGYYDKGVYEILQHFEESNRLVKYGQELLFKAQMVRNQSSPF